MKIVKAASCDRVGSADRTLKLDGGTTNAMLNEIGTDGGGRHHRVARRTGPSLVRRIWSGARLAARRPFFRSDTGTGDQSNRFRDGLGCLMIP
jgi:hypothetical protein